MNTNTDTTGSREARTMANRVVTTGLLIAGLILALPADARPRGHQGWGGPGDWIERHAEELGIDDATVAEIEQIIDASRDEAKAIYQEHRAARDALHAMLDADDPDVDAVMEQAERVGEIDVRKHKHRLATMLAVRAKLTPDQRSQLRELKSEMRERRGDRGKHRRHGRHERGDSDANAEAN